ncbi:HEAT repeat domain-containing protein [bacterium]|nr:HEAT repeat domain-containing protein [bacterium]
MAVRIELKALDPLPELRLLAIQVAVSMNHPRVIPILEQASKDLSPLVALEALKKLKQFISESRFVSFLTRNINSPSEELRGYALNEIAKITQKRYISNYRLLPLNIKKLAGSAILKLDSTFVDHLIEELKSLDPDSRLRAALIMENLKFGTQAQDALLMGMKDPSSKVRAAIVKTLGVLGNKALFKHLIGFFNDPDERVRANTIEAIKHLGHEQAVQVLSPFLKDPNNRVRANAALAVWQLGKVKILPIIHSMLSMNHLMRASALWVLGVINSETNIPIILRYFKDKDDTVRLNAIKAISKIHLETLRTLIPALRKDPNPEIRRLVEEISYKLI